MKVSFNANRQIVDVLKTAAKITPKRTTQAVLQNVHVSLKGDDITIEATDLGVWFRQTVFVPSLDVAQPFSVMLNRDAVLKMKPSVQLALNETFYSIGGITYKPTAEPAEFPRFPELDTDAVKLNLHQQYFDDFATCAACASDLEVRPILTAVCHRKNEIFATDGLGLCLAVQTTSWPKDVTVPASCGPLIQKAFGKSGAYMSYDSTYARYHGNGSDIIVKTIQGQYPDVSRILLTSAKTEGVIADVKPWIAACDSVLTAAKQTSVRLQLDRSSVTVTAGSPAQGFEFETVVPISSTKGEFLTMTCHAQYLRDALEQVGDGVLIQFNGASHPFMLTSSPDKPYQRKALMSPILPRG